MAYNFDSKKVANIDTDASTFLALSIDPIKVVAREREVVVRLVVGEKGFGDGDDIVAKVCAVGFNLIEVRWEPVYVDVTKNQSIAG